MRPTPDALREQAFAILAPRLEGAVFLDLFAGTGINSLEALSRGAGRAVVVERGQREAALIRRNFEALGVAPGRWRLVVSPARRAVCALAAFGERCHVAWCDPPFAAWDEGAAALVLARENGLLLPDARVVLEAPTTKNPAPAGFVLERRLRGGMLLRNDVDRGGEDGG